MLDGMKGIIRYVSAMAWFTFVSIFLLILCLSVSALDQVETDIEFEFLDGTNLDIDVTVDVYSVTLPANGVTYTQNDIQSLSNGNPEMMGAIKISVKGLVLDQLQASFPNSDIISIQELPIFSSGVFTDTYRLSFLPSFFSLNESVDVDDFVNGFLDCGAYVNYSFTLKSYAGWNQSYSFTILGPIGYKRTNGNVQQNKINWVLKTAGKPSEKNAQLTILETNPTTSFSQNESLHVEFFLNFTNSKNPVLIIRLQGFSIEINSYEILPDFLSNIHAIPADAIRLTILQNLTSWESVKNQTFDPTYELIKPILENSSFNQTIIRQFSWVNTTLDLASEPYNISSMDNLPAITANYQDESITFTICNISSRVVFGLINAGATLNISAKDVIIGDNLDHIPFPYNGTILFPEHVFLNEQNQYTWDAATPIKGSFSSTSNPEYTEKNMTTTYEIELKNTDLNLLSFFTGRTEVTMGLHLKEIQKRNITEIPFQFILPKKIQLSFLNSDAFRVCTEENVFSESQIQEFTIYQKSIFQSRSKMLFPLIKGNAQFDQSSFEKSLQWDGNISSMKEDNPIIISSSMQTAFPLAFEFSIIPPSLSIQTLNLSFSGITDQDVTYSMVFPKGVYIDVNDSLNRAIVKRTPDGNMFFSVSFSASEGGKIDSVLLTMKPSGLYILGIFIPCIISILITIILFVLVFIIRKKRRTIPPSQNDVSSNDYQQEDYYIPPPPSKRK